MQMNEPLSKLREIDLICKFMEISLCKEDPSGFLKRHWKLARGFRIPFFEKVISQHFLHPSRNFF
jgi:hypothetical protein